MTLSGTFDVVVCGAGPVGLTAAALLAARGVTVAVLEQHSSTSDEPKAISIAALAARIPRAELPNVENAVHEAAIAISRELEIRDS